MKAADLVLRLEDLPGSGWQVAAGDGEEDQGTTSGQVLLDQCLDRLMEGRIEEAADSPRFLHAPAQLAYSTAILFDGPDSAESPFVAIASDDFARCFAEAVAADVEVRTGGAELLGTLIRSIEPLVGSRTIRSVVHRMVFSGADENGLTAVNVDLVVLWVLRALVILWVADAPEPFPEADRLRIVERLSRRLSPIQTAD